MTTNSTIANPELTNFYRSNPDFDALQIDFHDPAELSRLQDRLQAAGVPDAQLHAAVERLQASHRLLKLEVDATLSHGLIDRGIRSANQLARIPRQVFVEDIGKPLGLTANAARALHRRANAVRNKSMHLWASLRGTVGSSWFRDSAMDTVSTQLKQTFQNLPSYQDLFGSLDYCSCPECRSIFGPAAYLVDLLRIIDEYVTKPNAATLDPAFLFSARRPDIGKISLTCSNTNTLTPYLQIVNERLLAYAQKTLGAASTDAVEQQMATTLIYPQALPFNAPLAQTQVLLEQTGVPYDTILSAWRAPAAAVAARRLGLSPEQQKIVTTALSAAADIAPYFQVSDTEHLSAILRIAQTFMDKTRMDYAALLTLLNQDLSNAEQQAGLQVNFFINQGLDKTWLSLGQDPDKTAVLQNLGLAQLDQINRLSRLAASVGQPAQDLDWALRCVQGGGAALISDASLTTLQGLRDAAAQLGLELPAATVLLGPIKTYGQGSDGAGSPFDRLFNSTALLAQNAPYHPSGNPLNSGYTDAPLPWTPGSSAAADINAINRILPGLNLGLAEANALGLYLYGAKTPQRLTVQTISVLYRHALLMRTLPLPANRHLLLLALLAPADAQALTILEIQTLIEKNQWLMQTGLSVYQMDYILRGNPSVYVNPLYPPAKVNDWLRGLWNITSLASPSAHDDIRAQVAVLFGLANPLTDTLMKMALAAVALPAGVTDWSTAFLTPAPDEKTPLYADYVQAVLHWVSRWAVMAQALDLADATLANVAAHPAAYQLPASFNALSWEAVRGIQQTEQMMQGYGDLQQNLLGYIALADGAPRPSDNALLILQKATGWNPDTTRALLASPVPGDIPIVAQLAALQTCFDRMDKLGADPGFMASIAALAQQPAADGWPIYTQAAAAVAAKTASLYGAQWDGIWNPLSGAIAARLRDAALALVLAQLHTLDPTIKTARNVYEFLLTDVEMGPATTISYIKEALNAAQLYLQRCRLRLEPGVEDMSQIQDAWWEWMMNYRIWEANREIFVYPENYLVPTLRKNTTPQFTALCQALQQSDVTQSYVGSAFTTYINGFADISQLKPVDAYRTHTHDRDIIYLLSRSKTSPYTFYYCQQPQDMPWTPWEKIDLSINSPNCTLVYAFNRPFLFWSELKKNNTSAVSGDAGKVSTNNSVAYTASLMYSFLNQQGEWVQPQTLVDQAVVLFQADDNRHISLEDLTIFDGLFDMDAPAWNKVFAFNVTAQNLTAPTKYPAEAERLVVMYGPDLIATGNTVDAQTSAPTTDPNAQGFWSALHHRAEDHNRMVAGSLSGNITLRPVSVLNFSLENDVLVRRQEWLLTDPYQSATPLSSIRAEMQSSGDVMQIAHSGQPVTDNRSANGAVGLTSTSRAAPVNGNAFINAGISPPQSLAVYQALQQAGVIDASGAIQTSAMAALDLYAVLAGMTVYNQFGPAQFASVLQVLFNHMEATELFSSVGGSQATVIPVGTQPGWFLFYAGDEIFLLSPVSSIPGKPAFDTFATGVKVGAPPITATFAIMQYQQVKQGGGGATVNIDASVSKSVFDALSFFGLIIKGQVSASATMANVKMALGQLLPPVSTVLTPDQVSYIYRALKNFPMIFSNAFIGGQIDQDTSAAIYEALQFYALVDPNGRIDEDNLTGENVQLALASLLYQKTIAQSTLAGIYQTLAQAPQPIALSYVNTGAATGIAKTSDFHFDVTRLSTGAVNRISRALFVDGVDSLLALSTQQIPAVPVLPLERFSPSAVNLNWPSALDATQVDFDGLYGQYFWEIFYFIPMLVANGLNTNQQFQQAQTWLQYIFNPTTAEQFVDAALIFRETGQAISLQQADLIITQLQNHTIGTPAAPILNPAGEVNPGFSAITDLSFLLAADPTLTREQVLMVRNILLNYQLNAPASHFWNFRPFRNHTLQSLQDMLSDSNPAIKVYNDDPFDPFAIARLRIGAFEKSTLMAYIDNLIAWGDQLFTQDTWESITAAYMLYVYAYNLLGPRPEQVGTCPGDGLTLNFDQIKEKYPDGIPQFLIELEHFVPDSAGSDQPMMGHAFNDLSVYFCVPENSALMARWDTVSDRMSKINNSMNIQGIYRALALFEPPINPLDLVRAAAAGNNVQAIAASSSQLSPYRFNSAIGSAQSLCAILMELGNAILAALEKNDAEGLAMLRANQEGQILDMMTQIKQSRIDELHATIQSLTIAQAGAAYRVQFYTDLINNNLSDYEQTSLSATADALAFNILGSISKTAATIAYAVPQVGSPFAMTYGGIQLGSAVNATSGVFEIGAAISSYVAQRASTMGGYARRSQDWTLQQHVAQTDAASIAQQLTAAGYQLQAAQQDLAIQKKNIAQSQAIETYLSDKFTNQDLYQWMLGRLSAVYFQTYGLALQVARQAQTAYQFETDTDQNFLSFDYWDSLHKGLTAGEGLRLALNRMDTSYRSSDVRRLEIEKTISLAMLAPDQLLALKTKGECAFSFSEALFDYDYPGQYSRKIKTISVSIPAIVGPYQNIKAILTQTKNSVATAATIEVVKYLLDPSNPQPASGLRQNWAPNQSIAISRGMDNSGLFVLDFQDPRYLPFENTGAVADWTLSMPRETNRYDFEQLSDVIITLRYTALYDGKLATDVVKALGQAPLTGGVYVDGAAQSGAWQAFLTDHGDSARQTLTLNVDPAQLGYFKSLTYGDIVLQLTTADGSAIADGARFVSLTAGAEPVQNPPFTHGQAVIAQTGWNGKTLTPSWTFSFALDDPQIRPLLTDGFIDGSKLLNLQVVALYAAKVF